MRKIVILLAIFFINIYAETLSYKVVKLINYAQKHPKDIKSREILLKYFYKKNNKEQLLKYSKELLTIDPKNKILSTIIDKSLLKERQERMIKTLNRLFDNKEYLRYINFYTALIDINEKLSSDLHTKAIYSAIQIDDYTLAQKIFQNHNLPLTPLFGKVMVMLDKKLGSGKNL